MLKELTILYVDDESFILDNALEFLGRLCKEVVGAKDGKEAYELYKSKQPDIIIADIEMPFLNGLELAKKIRQEDKKVQIILATAYTNTEYLLKAVELNLVKYLVKPIAAPALKEALHICEKNILSMQQPIKELGDGFSYHLINRILQQDNKSIKLTNHEMLFLELLIKNPHRAVTYTELENNIWSDEGMSENAIRSLVRAIRKKLPKDAIENVSKVGYKIHLL